MSRGHRSARVLFVLALALVLGACNGTKAGFGEERAAEPASKPSEPPAKQPAGTAAGFDTYNDEASDRYLTAKIAAALEAEIRAQDEARAREEARQRAAAEQRVVVEHRYDPYGRGYRYADPYDRYYGRHYRPSPIPWATLVGGSVGAIIGHQSGRRDRGLAIGAGIGLMHDLLRWHW